MEEKVRELYERYSDACCMCTKLECDNCWLNVMLIELEEILGIHKLRM